MPFTWGGLTEGPATLAEDHPPAGFVLTCRDRPDAGRGSWTVVPGSGTGEPAGLRGRGAFTVALGADGAWRAEDRFTHWFGR